MKKALSYIIPVASGFLLGFLASRLQADAIANWYPYLDKPSLTPPNMVFPIAWGILYLLSGISAGIIYNTLSVRRNGILSLWCVQLILNFLWSVMFFYLQNPMLGMINILLLDVVVIWYAVKSWSQSKAASVMYWPYVLWLCFATYLNIYILINN